MDFSTVYRINKYIKKRETTNKKNRVNAKKSYLVLIFFVINSLLK